MLAMQTVNQIKQPQLPGMSLDYISSKTDNGCRNGCLHKLVQKNPKPSVPGTDALINNYSVLSYKKAHAQRLSYKRPLVLRALFDLNNTACHHRLPSLIATSLCQQLTTSPELVIIYYHNISSLITYHSYNYK